MKTKEPEYQSYSEAEIETMLNEPWEVSDRPYMLHASMALNSLYELFAPEDDEEEEAVTKSECIWGNLVLKRTIDRLAADLAADFNDAASNYKPVRIAGKSYGVRKRNAYDHTRLGRIFNFPEKGDCYELCPEGLMNLAPENPRDDAELWRTRSKANREYLRKVIKLAEDDANDGWNRLTDIEVIIYCWAQYYNKHQDNNWKAFCNEYKDFFYVSEADVRECFNEKAAYRQQPIGMYTFSREKAMAWNERNGQRSEADKMTVQEAEDYWYETALKTTFIPIDLK